MIRKSLSVLADHRTSQERRIGRLWCADQSPIALLNVSTAFTARLKACCSASGNPITISAVTARSRTSTSTIEELKRGEPPPLIVLVLVLGARSRLSVLFSPATIKDRGRAR
jgi:hypothetical protein